MHGKVEKVCQIQEIYIKSSKYKVDTEFIQYIDKKTGFPYENYEYKKDGQILIEKYKELTINETTNDDIKMPNIDEYIFIE